MPKSKNTTANRSKRLDTDTMQALERAEQVMVEQAAKSASQQPRFQPNQDDFMMGTYRWAKAAFEVIPPYASDSRLRSRWLSQFWPNEPYLAGVINSVVQVDRNRGWTLVGGRNQVLRFTDILHNWQVQAGRASWREGVSVMAQSFYTTDIGGLAEVGRMIKNGPMAGLFSLDPTRCVLTPRPEAPLKYYPPRATLDGKRMLEMAPTDYMRTASQINVDETYNALGYCALSRCVELAITMLAVWRHEQEMLFARAPTGLLLLKGITKQTWDNAMIVRNAVLEGRMQEWFGAVAVLATAGVDDVDAKLVALSQLPEGFDQQVFTDLLIYGYALAFGYDPREFWPVSSGALGTAMETESQHRKATGKGGKEFVLSLQEELQGNLPDTLHFEFDERDVDGEMSDALLQEKQVAVVGAMGGLLSQEQSLTLLAEQGIIPPEWAVGGGDVESTDIEDADSPGNDNEDVEGETPDEETPTETQAEQTRMLEYPEVQRAMARYPAEPLVVYEWPSGRVRDITPQRKRSYYPVVLRDSYPSREADDILRAMALEVEALRSVQPPAPIAQPVTPAAPAQPVNVTIHNSPPAVNIQQEPGQFSVQIEPTPVTIENTVNVPKIDLPEVTVSVPATVVNVPAAIVNVPAPVVNVQVDPPAVTVQNEIKTQPASNPPDEKDTVLQAIRKMLKIDGR